ncbi:hypothetical protein ICW40_01200 [Actinotalea ferrariae]|uniref:hypothetical protein n=1 Tax=Actinotalea ferrariae TaxID=1386098 RepID=UPI001C8B13BE|nr:hypothetical protein [Actinotalea ferrariae]MBX9243422.1 hypothetical protein [Actinotalea ferrariae]
MAEHNWRELLDDPEVERIVGKVSRIEGRRIYHHPNDALLLDDLESYLWDASVRVAEKADFAPADPHWYAWLYAGLRMIATQHRSKTVGEYGSHQQRARTRGILSIDAEMEHHAETGGGHSLFTRQLTASDPLAHILHVEQLEAAIRRAAAATARGGAYITITEDGCSEPLCNQPAVTTGRCQKHYAQHRAHWVVETCTITDCTKPIQARGLCGAHYFHARKANADAWQAQRETPRGCAIEGCTRRHKGYGYCRLHLDQARRRGEL